LLVKKEKPSMPRSTFLILVILLAIACKKDENNQADSSFLGPLQGRWQWIRQTRSTAVFGDPDTTITAASRGITEFLNMNSNSTWSLVSNGLTVKNGTYRVDTLYSPGGPIAFLDFVYQGKDSSVDHWLTGNNDTLFTADPLVNPTWNVDMYVRHN
jgi:hypothetical protein